MPRRQLRLGQAPGEEIRSNPKSRDDIPAVRQRIRSAEQLRARLFALLDQRALPEVDRTAGPGPGADSGAGGLQQGLGCARDRQQEWANHPDTVRALLGRSDCGDRTRCEPRTVVGNVSLRTSELLAAGGRVAVESGRKAAEKAWRAMARAVCCVRGGNGWAAFAGGQPARRHDAGPGAGDRAEDTLAALRGRAAAAAACRALAGRWTRWSGCCGARRFLARRRLLRSSRNARGGSRKARRARRWSAGRLSP